MTAQLLSEELDKTLSGSRIDKIFQPEKYTVVLHLRTNEGIKKLLISFSPSCPRVNITQATRENPMMPPSFCMLLRKYLSGSFIQSISNPGCERLIEINVSNTDELYDKQNYRLIIELMGRYSNCILVNGNGKILDSAVHVDFDISRVREVMPARIYDYPPKQNKLSAIDALELTKQKKLPILEDEINRPIDKALLNSISGLSPLLSSQLCVLSGLDTRLPAKNLSEQDRTELIKICSSFLSAFVNREYQSSIYSSEDDVPMEYSPFSLIGFSKRKLMSSISECIDEFYKAKDSNIDLDNQKHRLLTIVNNALMHADKKAEIHRRDIEDGQKSEKYKRKGDLLLCFAYSVPESATTFECEDVFDETLPKIKITLDPSLNASDNAQEYFKKFRKAKRKLELSENYVEDDKKAIDYLRSLKTAIIAASDSDDISAISDEISNEIGLDNRSNDTKKKHNPGVINPNTSVGKAKSGKASSRALRAAAQRIHSQNNAEKARKTLASKNENYRKYISSDGYTILCGRNNIQNDALTFKTAGKNDWWFHVKGLPGTHVILQAKPNEEMPSDVAITEAASLAAFFSKGTIIEERMTKEGSKPGLIKAEIDYCPVTHVKKQPKAKPGMVIYEGYYSMVVPAIEPNS